MAQGVSAVKKQGSGIDFHKFAICLWLDFLYDIGYHSNYNSKEELKSEIKNNLDQFKELVEYDHKIGDGVKTTVDKEETGGMTNDGDKYQKIKN